MIKRGVLFILLLLANLSLMAQMPITGVITDQGGQPMTGVTILVKGTTIGALSDPSGKYSIAAPAGSTTLVFSFVGFTTQEVTIDGKSVINVSLEEALTGLNEVVVVGYGSVKKKLVTGATVQVKGDAIQKLSTVSPMTALQGQTPGLSIIKNTGEPGAGFKVTIRGMGTIGNSQPLYVIDGVPGGNIDYLAAADIESIDVLKDAASSAIYGSRGANGVILVTTKKGVKPVSGAKANITYDATFGWQNLYKKLPMMNALDYSNILQEARVNSGLPLLDFPALVPNWADIQSGAWKGTDWLDQLTVKNAPVTSNAINIFGGSELTTFSLGVSHSNQTGIIGNPVESKYERYTFRLNSDYILIRDRSNTLNILKVGETLRYMYADRNGIGIRNGRRNREPYTTSAPPRIGASSAPYSLGSSSRSASWIRMTSPVAYFSNRRIAAPLPRLMGLSRMRSGVAPWVGTASIAVCVPSSDPSLATMISFSMSPRSTARTRSTTVPIVCASL